MKDKLSSSYDFVIARINSRANVFSILELGTKDFTDTIEQKCVPCAIWYHLYNLKNEKNSHGGASLLVKFQVPNLPKHHKLSRYDFD